MLKYLTKSGAYFAAWEIYGIMIGMFCAGLLIGAAAVLAVMP